MESLAWIIFPEICLDKFWKLTEIFYFYQIDTGITIFNNKNCKVTFGFEYINYVSYLALQEFFKYDPRHDKTNKMSVRPAKTQISPGIRPVWSVFAVRSMVAKDTMFLHADSEDSDQTGRIPRLIWADAQADLSLRWAHTRFVGFVMLRLNYYFSYNFSFVWQR